MYKSDEHTVSEDDFFNNLLPRRTRLMKKMIDQLKSEGVKFIKPEVKEVVILGVTFETEDIPIIYTLYKNYKDIMKLEIDELAGFLDPRNEHSTADNIKASVRNLESDLISFI